MLIGYMRPDDNDPTCERQAEALRGINCDNIITEQHASAKRRIELQDLMDNLEQGDQVIVTKLYILADSTRHLVELLQAMEEKGASMHAIKEDIDTNKEKRYPFHYIVEQLVAFQGDVISEKTKKGMRHAQQKGIAPGRPRKPDENVKRAIMMYESKKYSLADIREETGISKTTLYRYLEN